MLKFSAHYLMALGLMLATFAASEWLKIPAGQNSLCTTLHQLPRQFGTWYAMQESEIEQPTARILGLNQSLVRRYRDVDSRTLEVIIIGYNNQKFEAQVHSPQHCLPGAGWAILQHDCYRLPSGYGQATKIRIEKAGVIQDVLYWFVVNGAFIQNEYHLKLEVLKNRILRRPNRVYFLRLIVAPEQNGMTGNRILDDFLPNFLHAFRGLIQVTCKEG